MCDWRRSCLLAGLSGVPPGPVWLRLVRFSRSECPSGPPTHAKQVTFSKDVAPIFQEKCQECHQPNSIAPMSLITYQEARPWARSIKERVATRQMPPWHIDRSVGVQHFKNDMSLSDEQVDTIVRWVDGGAPQGDPKDLPPPVALVTDNEWKGRERRLRRARPGREVVRVHDAGAAPGRLVPPDVGHPADRAALGEDGRDSSDQPQVAQDHPPLDRVPRAEQRSRGRQHRHGERPDRFGGATISSTAARS